MFSALFYLQFHSLKNRLLMRLQRLKQPKYLVGAMVGGLYFYFYFFRYLFSLPGGPHNLSWAASPETRTLYEALGAAVLLVAVLLLGWILPHERAALAFSEAEVAFLFSAPITRRGLIHFKLLRSQAAILFTTLILMLVTNRFGGKFWFHAAGWWLILSILNLHLLGASFARTTLLDRGISNWRRRALVLTMVLLIAGGMFVWARRSLPRLDLGQISDLKGLQDYVQAVLTSGPFLWLLYPFRLIVRPYLAPDPHSFFLALGPALALGAAHYWWVARGDVAFEEASVDASRRLAQRIAAVRSGNYQARTPPTKAKRPPFLLRPTGPPAVALLWKNLISAGQAFTPRFWLIVALTMLMVAGFVAQRASNAGLVSALGMAAAMLVLWSLFIGPQVLRQDLRLDLPLADLLKMYPLRGWQIVLGELLAPAAILAAIQWVLLMVAEVLLWNGQVPHLTRLAVLGIGLGAALVLPVLNLLILQIPNAAVLLFPAWLQSGKERAQGIEVTGQRIIAVLAQILVFILALIPAALGFGAVYFVSQLFLGRWGAIVPGCFAATLVLAGEALLGIILLGRVFEKLDVSSELTAA
jgi:ABC-2 type transport system permease protein